MATPYITATPIPHPTVPVGGELVAPLPFASVEGRIVALAERMGVVAAPRIISAVVASTDDGAATYTFDIVADGTEGPVFVVGLDFLARYGRARLQMQSGARRLCEGQNVRVADAIQTPAGAGGQHGLRSPIVILRDDTLQVTVDMANVATTPTVQTGEALIARCLVLRSRDGERLGAVADEIARLILLEGEWYAAGVEATENSPDSVASQNVNDDMIVEAWVAVTDPPDLEEPGTTSASRLWASIGNYDVTAKTGLRNAISNTVDLGRTAWADHLRYPVRRGQRISVRGEWASSLLTKEPVRFCVIGRRTVGQTVLGAR